MKGLKREYKVIFEWTRTQERSVDQINVQAVSRETAAIVAALKLGLNEDHLARLERVRVYSNHPRA